MTTGETPLRPGPDDVAALEKLASLPLDGTQALPGWWGPLTRHGAIAAGDGDTEFSK